MSDDGQKRAEDLARVLEVTRAMVAAGDLDDLLRLVIDRSTELLDAERASVFLYDAKSNELISRVASGVDALRIPADRGVSGDTVRTGRTINVADVRADARWNPEVDRKTGFSTRNILSVPLHDYQQRLVGVLQVLNKRAGAFDDHDVTLAETLGAQAGVALQRASLIEHFLEKQQMERAMQIAQDIQQGLMPATAPHCEGFDIAGFNRPADETGGDTYDFFELPGRRCMLVVADATGHGIGPALLIAETRAMLRAVSAHCGDVTEVLARVNDLLTFDLDEGRFVTCFYGVLDPATATMHYASAGHGPILLYSRADDEFHHARATSLPLGIMQGIDFDEVSSRAFAPGDLAVVTTDGFTEASAPDGEMFGEERLMEVLRRHRDLQADGIIKELYAAVTRFTLGRPQADDLTAVVVRKS